MQTTFEKIDRLRAMVAKGQQTWDLSPKDVEAIQMAVDVFELLAESDDVETYDIDLESYPDDTPEDMRLPKMLKIGFDDEHYGHETLDCFVKGAEAARKLRSSST